MNETLQIKSPSFIIFPDKDGTLNLEDKKLNPIFTLISIMNGMIIPITGRTVGDIHENLKENNLRLPEILIGDNGANIYSTKKKQFLMKKSLDPKKPLFFLINSYTTGLQPMVLHNILRLCLPQYKGNIDAYEVGLPTEEGIPLPCGAGGIFIHG